MTDASAAEIQDLRAAISGLLARSARSDDAEVDGGQAADRALWSRLEAADMTLVSVAEQAGGSGGGLIAAGAVLEAVGASGARVPVAEAILSGWLLSAGGLGIPAGMITTGVTSAVAEQAGAGWRVRGQAARVAYGRDAEFLVVLAAAATGDVVAMIPRAALTVVPGTNMAGEARDDLSFACDLDRSHVAPAPPSAARELLLRGGLSRALMVGGALDRALELTVAYAKERRQFGRPIGSFQAVQQSVAEMAAEVAAARTGARSALASCAEHGFSAPASAVAVAAAKVLSVQAAGSGARIAHQVHGAIGLTKEHVLHRVTTRLWSWRAEWGGELRWTDELAELVVSAEPYRGWSAITAR